MRHWRLYLLLFSGEASQSHNKGAASNDLTVTALISKFLTRLQHVHKGSCPFQKPVGEIPSLTAHPPPYRHPNTY